MTKYEIRDPIHKRIAFNEFERSIIDHRFVQRLRHISQLGFHQTYVYPGGVHNRFTHALGAMHVAGRLFGRVASTSHSEYFRDHLTNEELDALHRRVRLAGLLHDVGHGPFSHASEVVFPQLKDLPLNWDWWKGKKSGRQAMHEDYSVLIIQTMAQEGALPENMAQDICSLIHEDAKPSEWFDSLTERIPSIQNVLKGLISGEVDCDRMDYLLRDSYYCGVAYGNYDIDWLISSMGVSELKGELVFTLTENGVRAFEDLLLARYHMIDQVYYHKTKAGFAHYLEKAIKEQEIRLEIPTDPYAYADLHDGAVLEMMRDAAKNPENYYSHHLINRLPARRILRLHDQEVRKDATLLKKLKKQCDKEGIRWFDYSVKKGLSDLGNRKVKTQKIFVKKKTLTGYDLVPVFKYSDLLQKYNEKLQFTDFFVFREDIELFDDNVRNK